MNRHPLAEKLHALRQKKNATAAELKATLHTAQLEVEKYWDSEDPRVSFSTAFGTAGSTCGQPGCNYRRYPASRFCMYHVTGKDTFAARLRHALATPT